MYSDMQYDSISRDISQVNVYSVKFLLMLLQRKIPFFSPFVMKLLSPLIRIHLVILSVNIKTFLRPFNGREASIINLAPEKTGGREKSVCLSGYLLTEGLLLLVF